MLQQNNLKKKIIEVKEENINEQKQSLEPDKVFPQVTQVKEYIDEQVIDEKEPIIKENISPELYSEIEKKLIEYFNARPIEN